MLEWLPKSDPVRRPDVSTVDVPLGHLHVSQETGQAYDVSNLGLSDVPAPYLPNWEALALLRREGGRCGRRC